MHVSLLSVRMTLSQEQSYHSMFGLPVITMIPRVCTYNDLYRAVAERCLPSKMLKENLQGKSIVRKVKSLYTKNYLLQKLMNTTFLGKPTTVT